MNCCGWWAAAACGRLGRPRRRRPARSSLAGGGSGGHWLSLWWSAAAVRRLAQQLVVGGHRRQRPGVRRQVASRRSVRDVDSGPVLASGSRRDGSADGSARPLPVGGLARLQRDRVRGQRAGPQRRGQARDHVLVGEVAVQQQDLDQCPGAVRVAVDLAGRGPPGVVDRGEPARGPGLLQRGRTGQRAGLADQGFEVVVQFQAGRRPWRSAARGGPPRVPARRPPGGRRAGRTRTCRPISRVGHRVAVGADGDLAVAVDPRREQPAGLERLGRQRQRAAAARSRSTRRRCAAATRSAGASSCRSHWSTISFSSARESTSGTGVKWLRRKQPIIPSTPPFS